MHRSPALLVVLFLILGILLGHLGEIENGIGLFFLTSTVLLGALFSLLFKQSRGIKSLSIYLSIVCSGIVLCLSDRSSDIEFVEAEQQESIHLEATSFASGLEHDLYFDAKYITGSNRYWKGKLRVFLPKSNLENRLPLKYGAKLKCSGKIQKFSNSRNPGQADYSDIFENKGIRFSMKALSCSLDNRSPWKIFRWAYRVREHIKVSLLHSDLDPRAKGISLALSIGDKSALPETTKESFKASGLMHLLAISGLHVGFIALGVFHLLSGILRRLSVPHRFVLFVRVLLVLLILLLYTILTGLTDSVLRSSIMCSVFVLSLLSERAFNSLNALALSAIIILVVRPHHLFDLGFQLSFSAVLGLVIVYPRLTERLESFPLPRLGKAIQMVSLSSIAYLATAPILLIHFSFAPLVGIISSVVSTPLCFLSLTSLWIWILLCAIPASSVLVDKALIIFLNSFSNTASFFSSKQFTNLGLEIDETEAWVIFLLFVALLILHLQLTKIKGLKWMVLFLLPCLVSLFFVRSQGDFKYDIIFFDVGHGDSILIRSPTGKNILIDAGDKSEYKNFKRDIGRSVLLPAFKKLGVEQIDLAFLSHRHRDHFGGFESLIESMPVDIFLSNDDGQFVSETWNSFNSVLRELDIDHLRVNKGDEISMGGINIKVVNPLSKERLANENNQSLQLLIEIGEVQLLFLGDSELEAEWSLVDENTRLYPDIIKVGHHGSKTSSSLELIQYLRNEKKDQTAIISASESFRPPSKVKRSDWESFGFDTECTCDNGAIWIQTDGKHFYTPS